MKLSHLRMMAAFASTAHIGQAAHALGITQPAASRLLAEIERICGYRVHTRSGRGVELTEVGTALAQRADRILTELRDTAREVDEFGKGSLGQVTIGAVTAPALDIVLPAVREIRFAHPNVQIDVSVAPSNLLFDQLLAGRLDFVIARIPTGADANAVTAVEVAPEPIAIVARSAHPLARRDNLTFADLAPYDWVLPSRGNPMADAVLARFAELKQPAPIQRMTTSSFLLTMSLLQQTNAIAPLSSAVASQFADTDGSDLVRLKLETQIAVSPYSILLRRAGVLPLAARNVLGVVQGLVARQKRV
ncbi:MAG: LysR family transcriptional regulator [Cypionkella sp.]|nr:LysR family transcriptional regulator [Cypionkella sp.]